MADTYALTIPTTGNPTLTKNGNAVAFVDVSFQVEVRPAETTTDGTVFASRIVNASLQYRYMDTVSDAAILAQAGGTGALGATVSPKLIGVLPAQGIASSRAGDTITLTIGGGAAVSITSGPNATVQDQRGAQSTVEAQDQLANPRLQ